jgi:hypothetical protein
MPDQAIKDGPRPAVVIQADWLEDSARNVAV